MISEAISLAPTTSGAFIINSIGTYLGHLYAVQLIPSSSAPTSTGGLLELKGHRTNIPMFVKNDLSSGGPSGVFLPRIGTVLSTDAATASTGSDRPPIFNEQLVITVTSGSTGGMKAATLRLFID
jgi:hypothetical protein